MFNFHLIINLTIIEKEEFNEVVPKDEAKNKTKTKENLCISNSGVLMGVRRTFVSSVVPEPVSFRVSLRLSCETLGDSSTPTRRGGTSESDTPSSGSGLVGVVRVTSLLRSPPVGISTKLRSERYTRGAERTRDCHNTSLFFIILNIF